VVFLLRLGTLGGLDYNFLFFQDPIWHVGCTVLDINPPRSQKKKEMESVYHYCRKTTERVGPVYCLDIWFPEDLGMLASVTILQWNEMKWITCLAGEKLI
jgi:hypothetical protein